MGNTMRRTLLAAVIGILITFYATGWPWNQDMSRQPAPAPYHGPRPAVKATLPVNGEFGWSRTQFEELYPSNPLPPSDSNVEQGQSLFMSYCMPCHGETGKGDGPVAAKFIPPSDLSSPFIQENSDAWFYGTIRNGVRLMPRYGAELSSHRSWQIVTYLRTLKQPSP